MKNNNRAVRIFVLLGLVSISSVFVISAGAHPVEIPHFHKKSYQGSVEPYFDALHAVDFIDANNGWAVGENAAILCTKDGGQSWVLQHRDVNYDYRTLLSVSFSDNQHGLAVGQKGLVLRTDDGGKNWTATLKVKTPKWESNRSQIPIIEQAITSLKEKFQVECIDTSLTESEKTQSNPKKTKSKKVDTEIEDNQQPVPYEPNLCEKNEFEAKLETLINEKEWIENQPEFLKGGYFDREDYWKIQFVGTKAAYMGSADGLLYSSNRGKTWDIISLPFGPQIRNFFFLNETHGWIVGKGGFIATTNDGGKHWEEIYLDTPWRLSAVFFENARKGWVTGQNGIIMTTRDGGLTWAAISTERGDEPCRVFRMNGNRGFKTTSGKGFITQDGGHTWRSIDLPRKSPDVSWRGLEEKALVLAVSSADSDTIFAVGTQGLVLRSSDGGLTWTQLRSEIFNFTNDIKKLRSIDHARIGYNAALGYVHPLGNISRRFGPGLYFDAEFIVRRGRLKFGSGFKLAFIDSRETIMVPVGELDEDKPVELKHGGFLFTVPIIAQLSIFERGHWRLRAIASIGVVYHGMSIKEPHYSELPTSSNYKRSRIGFCTSQSLMFGWTYITVPNYRRRNMARGGVYLKIGIQESWTSSFDDIQTDLGHQDNQQFGTELYPFVAIGHSLYY